MDTKESLREIENLRLRFRMNNRLRLESLAALSKIFREHGEPLGDALLASLVFAIPEELNGGNGVAQGSGRSKEGQMGTRNDVPPPEFPPPAEFPPPSDVPPPSEFPPPREFPPPSDVPPAEVPPEARARQSKPSKASGNVRPKNDYLKAVPTPGPPPRKSGKR